MKYKLSFNKLSVILMYICIVGIFAFCLVTQAYPPTSFIIAWFAFWCIQAVITCKLQIDKRAKKDRTQFFEAIIPYVNEENASALIEKYIGIEPKYNKGKKGDK